MEKLQINEEKIHDFAGKLRQRSIIDFLMEYINWQRNYRSGKIDVNDDSYFPKFGPVSINLDLTTACNFRCSYCVDIKVLNTGDRFTYPQVVQTIDTLCKHGLKSVLLIGGGEPTLHPKFNSIVRYLKGKKLQIAIVTNGSRMDKIIEISDCLEIGDWIRVSLDAGTDMTFQKIHRPGATISLQEIHNNVRELKRKNGSVVVGYSYIIVWGGLKLNGVKLMDNIEEMSLAVKAAIDSGFDYISFKPCLLKLSGKETIPYSGTEEFRQSVLPRIEEGMEKAKEIAGEKLQVVTTLNLQAIFSNTFQSFKHQPCNCHTQLFRQIVSPIGIFHCPAYRGDKRTKVGSALDYLDEESFSKTVVRNYNNMLNFNAREICKDIVCFYNLVNNWIEELIESDKDVMEIETCEDHNFFL
ncbi:MAG: radical SAM protein [Candidatus Atribacteria bacterium]